MVVDHRPDPDVNADLAPMAGPISEPGAVPEQRPGPEPEPSVTVYWRPGCGFCSSLRRQLRKAGVETVEVDIWEEPDAAAFVRRHARGNETVPTVDVAGTVLVNPSAHQVVDLAQAAGITLGEPPPSWWQRRRGDDPTDAAPGA